MRRLRFSVIIEEDESIPGALAKGTRENVLETSSIAFEDAGLQYRRPGLVQLMPREELARLADFMGCDLARLVEQVGTVENADGLFLNVRFGSLALPRSDIEFQARRVGPLTLADGEYHRIPWLFSILPYCPVSLEKLVDTCEACGKRLGWSRCWGIGTCERCRTALAPSSAQPLSQEFADGYRLFAALLSPRAVVRDRAIAELPVVLQKLEPGILVHMALRLGATCQETPVVVPRRVSMATMDATSLASVVSIGATTLRGWPDSFRNWAGSQFESRRDDLSAFHQTRARIRRLGDRALENEAQVRLVREAMPSEFHSFVGSAATGKFYTATALRLLTSLRPGQIDAVRSELEDRRLPGMKRVRSQFSPERVEEFDQRYRSARRLRALTFRFMLPTYALEQFCCLGILEPEQDTAVQIARHGVCVTEHSVDRLLKTLRSRQSTNRGQMQRYRSTRLPAGSVGARSRGARSFAHSSMGHSNSG